MYTSFRSRRFSIFQSINNTIATVRIYISHFSRVPGTGPDVGMPDRQSGASCAWSLQASLHLPDLQA